MGGAGNIKHFLRMAEELGVKASAVYDGDKGAEKEEATRLFPNSMIEILPVSDMRDKTIGNVEKQGLFDKSGNIKPQHEEYLFNLITRIRTHLNS